MKYLLLAIRHLFCRNQPLTFVRNIYGAEIEFSGYRRSIWQCRCGADVLSNELRV